MLDPFTALSIAGNIVQFVDYTTKLISKSCEIYQSADGDSVEHLDLEVIASNLSRLTEGLRKDLHRHLIAPSDGGISISDTSEKRAEIQLGSINAKCAQEADALLAILRDLRVEGKHRKLQSFRQALLTIWKDDQIKSFANKLSEYRKALDTELLFSLRTTLDTSSQVQIESLLKLNRSIKAIAKDLKNIRDDNKKTQREILNAIQEGQWQGYNREHVAVFSLSMNHVVEEERFAALLDRFLHRLRFLTMSDRKEEIVDAHKATFHWIYTTTENQPWDNFTEWLQNGNGLYWITGKAGSGKSTLMKYIYQNLVTRKQLQPWAGDLPLITASYYFWNSGTTMQKSQMGLLQSLLYECLSQCQKLIPQIFPYRWRYYDTFGDDLRPWTRTELMQSFNRLLQQDGISAKFCFFVDGLDEFDGDHGEIVDLFKRVVSSSSVKACVSSRPLLVFEDGFGSSPKLRLHDLTQNDTKLYTNNQLERNQRFIALKKREPKLAPQLVSEIVDKSAGVFLWVTLVVRSLLEGLQNSDRISDLQRRLKQLPADLEDLYLVMIKSLEPFYEQQASHLFQIVHDARVPLSVLAVSFADEEEPEFALRARMPLDGEDITFRYEETVRRLNSRCKGLLEVRYHQGTDLLRDSKVDFLHRTVKDFLDTPDVWKRIISQSGREFNVDVSLMRSYILQLKWLYNSGWERTAFSSLCGEFMEFAARAEESSGERQSSYVDHFCETVRELWRVRSLADPNKTATCKEESGHGWIKMIPSTCNHGSFLHVAIWYGLPLYVKYKLGQESKPEHHDFDHSSLSCAIVPRSRDIWQLRPRNVKVVALLLEYGADPNRKIKDFGDFGVSKQVLHLLSKTPLIQDAVQNQNRLLSTLEVVKLLLEAGADPEACTSVNETQLPAIAVIDRAFGKNFPQQTTELKEFIREKLQEKVGISRAVEIEQDWEMMMSPEGQRRLRSTAKSEQEPKSNEARLSPQQALVRGEKKSEATRQQRESREHARAQTRLQQSLLVRAKANGDTVKLTDKPSKRQSVSFKMFMFWKSRRSEESDGSVRQSPSGG